MPTCAICERSVAAWLAHPYYHGGNEFIQSLGAVGSDLEYHGCPNCGADDLERHAWLYLSAQVGARWLRGKGVLHIGATQDFEAGLAVCLRRSGPAEYQVFDLVRGAASGGPAEGRQADATTLSDSPELPYANGSFDLIICNQQLHRVCDAAQTLAEFARCLVPDGLLLVQTLYAPKLKNTLEWVDTVPDAMAAILFADAGGKRLFGGDVAAYFHRAGFAGELRPHAAILPGHEGPEYGCNPLEPLFLFTKMPTTTP